MNEVLCQDSLSKLISITYVADALNLFHKFHYLNVSRQLHKLLGPGHKFRSGAGMWVRGRTLNEILVTTPLH